MSKENMSNRTGMNHEEEVRVYCDELEKQIGLRLKLGFHKVLGLPIEEYVSTLPRFQPIPQRISDKFDKILLIEPRIPVWLQLQIAGYKYFIPDETKDILENQNKLPYIAWLQDGSRKNLFEAIGSDERAATLQEGVSLLLSYPNTLNNHPIALPGSLTVSQNEELNKKIPCIYQWSDGQVGIGADYIGYLQDEGARRATCAKHS